MRETVLSVADNVGRIMELAESLATATRQCVCCDEAAQNYGCMCARTYT